MPEIEKALAELKRLMAYRKQMGCEDAGFRGIGLSSRKNLCLHPEVSTFEMIPLPSGLVDSFLATEHQRSLERRKERRWMLVVEI